MKVNFLSRPIFFDNEEYLFSQKTRTTTSLKRRDEKKRMEEKTRNSDEIAFHGERVFTWIATPANSAIIRSFSYTITRNVEYLPLSATR